MCVKKNLVCILVFCVAVIMANDLKLDYQISEGKARFVENIETNLGKNTVKIYTPAHNDVLESYLFQDFQKGQQIRCLPSLRQCRLRKIDRESMPDAGNVTESFVRSWNNGVNSISSKNAAVITELYYVDGDEIFDTVSLGPELRHFYESFEFPLYQEQKVPSDAATYKIIKPIRNRVKRDFTPLTSDCNGQTPVRIYGVDTGRSCNYLKICKEVVRRNGRDVFADCGDVHITSPLAYVCVCCPGVQVINPRGSDCACTKMG